MTLDKVERCHLPLFRLAILASLALAGCDATYDGTISSNPHSDVYVAMDDQSCVALAAHNRKPIHDPVKQFATPKVKRTPGWELVFDYELPPKFKDLYEQEKKKGKFLQLVPPVKIKAIREVYSENGIVKPRPPGPYTEIDERRRNAVEGEWVRIVDGPIAGKTVCVDPGVITPRWGPWPQLFSGKRDDLSPFGTERTFQPSNDS